MGGIASSLSRKPAKVLFFGLDDSGKSAILFKMKNNSFEQTVATNGFNVETIDYYRCRMELWDIGGGSKNRPLYYHYYGAAQAVIVVVDSVNQERFSEAKDAINFLLTQVSIPKCPLLVLANKQDLPNAVPPEEVVKALSLDAITDRQLRIFGTSAKTGDGVSESLAWLASQITEHF